MIDIRSGEELEIVRVSVFSEPKLMTVTKVGDEHVRIHLRNVDHICFPEDYIRTALCR